MSTTVPAGDEAPTVPDPVAFAVDALVARGALVERVDAHYLAVMPPPLAQTLRTPEELKFAGADTAGDVIATIGLGTGLLEDLLAFVKQGVTWAGGRLLREAPRAAQARSLAERFTVRNGVVDIVTATTASTTYLHAWTAFAVEADDRREGLVHVCCHPSGDTPERGFRALALNNGVVDADVGGAVFDESALARIVARTGASLATTVTPFVHQVERRRQRDRARIAAYFQELGDETRASRRIKDETSRQRKLDAYAADEQQKLADVDARFTLRVSASPVALLAVTTTVQQVSVRVRRRKAERLLTLRLPPEARALDSLHCAACDGVVDRPAVCDERLHLLCTTCVPRAEGRVACPACGARADNPGAR
jgi:hypothetical protein